MFDTQKKPPKIEKEVKVEAPQIKKSEPLNKTDLKTKPEQKLAIDDKSIHTMPEKFLPGGSTRFTVKDEGQKKKAPNKNIIIWIIVAILVIALVVLGAWFLLESVKTPSTENLIIDQGTQEEAPSQEEDSGETVEETDLCSPDNCEECDLSQCSDLIDFCHLEDICDENSEEGICPNFVCLTGPILSTEEDERDLGVLDLVLAKDTDFDLLTDIEEGIWGTDPVNSDTDGDGYGDGIEIQNLYNPKISGSGTGKLEDSDLIENYVNTKYGYSIFYPSSWQKSSLADGSQEIIFKSNTNEFIGVIVQKNITEYENIEDWYIAQYEGVENGGFENVLIGNWSGIKSSDGLNVYLMNNGFIYTIVHNIGLKTELNYSTTFDMMLKSFQLFESPVE